MKHYIKNHAETLLNVSELIISSLRKEQHLAGAEIALKDILEDFRNDLLGIRLQAEKEEGFLHE